MNLTETEQGRMNLWDKAFTAALNVGKDVHEAVEWAEHAVTAFESKFHPFTKELKDGLDNHAT